MKASFERARGLFRVFWVDARRAVPVFLALFAIASPSDAVFGARAGDPKSAPCRTTEPSQKPSPAETAARVNGATAGTAPEILASISTPEVRGIPTDLSGADILRKLAVDPRSFGAISVGRPSRGALVGGVVMPDGPLWKVVDPKHAFGTEESIGSIAKAIARVNAEHPGTPVLYVGQISSEGGGYLRPHRSHQSGRDVDLGYYYADGPAWYVRVTSGNLDRARSWALVRAFAEDPNVEQIFMDRSVQTILREYAESAGENRDFVATLFDGTRTTAPLIRHEWGHLTHMHVRFKCPVSQDAAIRAEGQLASLRRVPKATLLALQARPRRGSRRG